MTAKKRTEKCDARAKLLFCLTNPMLFYVLVAVAVVVCKAPLVESAKYASARENRP